MNQALLAVHRPEARLRMHLAEPIIPFRQPGLKFMRTLWVCNAAGGPQRYAATKPGSTPLGLEEAHRDLKISPAQFDEVAAELGRTLDYFKVPEREKEEALPAFAAHKGEVTEGYL
jgi:hemoglobin